MIARGVPLQGLASYRRRGRGLGAMPTLTAAQYAALNPWQQQAYGNSDPNFMNATGPGGSSSGGYSPPATSTTYNPSAALQAAVQNPQYATIPFGTSSTTTYTLDSFMAKWAAEAIAFPSSLGGADPVSEALAVAQSYCATEAMPDCNNLSAIAANYGGQVKAAFAAHPPPAYSSASSAAASGSSTPPSPGPGYYWDGTSWRAASTTNGSQQSSSVVVNPSPASQSTTDGSSLTSASSVTSLANGASVTTDTTTSTDLIPGIPNAALVLGGGALALILFVMASGGK